MDLYVVTLLWDKLKYGCLKLRLLDMLQMSQTTKKVCLIETLYLDKDCPLPLLASGVAGQYRDQQVAIVKPRFPTDYRTHVPRNNDFKSLFSPSNCHEPLESNGISLDLHTNGFWMKHFIFVYARKRTLE